MGAMYEDTMWQKPIGFPDYHQQPAPDMESGNIKTNSKGGAYLPAVMDQTVKSRQTPEPDQIYAGMYGYTSIGFFIKIG